MESYKEESFMIASLCVPHFQTPICIFEVTGWLPRRHWCKETKQRSPRKHWRRIEICFVADFFGAWHTSYLSFLLHRQDFRKPNFTPKKTTKGTKNTKNVSEKVKYMHFFTQSGKIYTWQKIFTQTCLWCLWQIWGMGVRSIPDICHFFYTGKIFGE